MYIFTVVFFLLKPFSLHRIIVLLTSVSACTNVKKLTALTKNKTIKRRTNFVPRAGRCCWWEVESVRYRGEFNLYLLVTINRFDSERSLVPVFGSAEILCTVKSWTSECSVNNTYFISLKMFAGRKKRNYKTHHCKTNTYFGRDIKKL